MVAIRAAITQVQLMVADQPGMHVTFMQLVTQLVSWEAQYNMCSAASGRGGVGACSCVLVRKLGAHRCPQNVTFLLRTRRLATVYTHTTACCPFPGTCLLPMTPPSVLFAVRVLAFSPPLWL